VIFIAVSGKLSEEKILVETGGKEIFDNGWYGNLEAEKLELDLIEAASLLERGRLDIEKSGGGKFKFSEFFNFCGARDPRFIARWFIYKDLRERGLPVRMGFKGCDFRVYDRGAKPENAPAVKWIVFASAEDYPCELAQLEKAMKLAQNIRAVALWAVVDNDTDCTFYIINEVKP